MKKPKSPTRSKLSVLRQVCNLIPTHLVSRLARETGASDFARTFSNWSHVVSLLFSQMVHSISLNDVCDTLKIFRGPFSLIRGATFPSKNGLSHANRVRPAEMAEKLFWETLKHLEHLSPRFGAGPGRKLAGRFRRSISVVDSTTIHLIASCMDWAKHRRRKAAAKCHVRLELQSFLPRFLIIDTARENDVKRAPELCADLKPGEIVIFDKGYMSWRHFFSLEQRGVWWVTRAKDKFEVRVVKKRLKRPEGKIIRDDEVLLTVPSSRVLYPQRMRRVVALVEVDGKEVEMTFLTNNFQWAASSVAGLYKARWQIEVFFKQIKQTLQLADFLGNSVNAVRWQIWTAMLLYVLLRFLALQSRWAHSFARLWTVTRSSLWLKLDLMGLLKSYGIAPGRLRMLSRPEQAYLPGFA